MNAIPHSIALLGLGLMGGSLARALRAFRSDVRIITWTPDAAEPHAALRAGVIDDIAGDACAAAAQADLIVLAAPVGASIALLGEVAHTLATGAILTDVCSVKAPLMDAAAAAGISDRYAGSHPLCGSHRHGWEYSRADLYQSARVFVTASANEATTRSVEAFWSGLGAQPVRVTAADHDVEMAWISHAPQVLSSALGAALAGAGIPPDRLGPGGRDVTRLSASSPALWADLLLHNREPVLAVLAAVRAQLETLTDALAAGDFAILERALAVAHEWSVKP